jgi:class 3 adenylate cyclase
MRSEPASRTLTFVFTDIDGSPRLWEEHQPAMQRASTSCRSGERAAAAGRRRAALELVRAACAEFTEGFATPDLKEAAALLDASAEGVSRIAPS